MNLLNFNTDNSPTTIGQIALQLLLKGNLVYEYNPLKVFRVNKNDRDEDLRMGENEYYPLHSLLNLDTTKLEFDLKHPVDMVILPSYDGSVNIILNDDLHPPRLINSRFSVTGMGTYLIVDREGDNDTNIYNKESFDTDISLYKRATTIAKLKFLGVANGGKLPVGNYNFYFKLSDADGNETDFIAESGMVSCFIGNLNDPLSIQGGIRDLNSFKAVHFKLSNLDPSYCNVVVYYSRSTSDNLANLTTEAFKILKNFPIYNKESEIRINGFEDTLGVSINELNQLFNIVKSAKTLEITLNMLFMGNVSKNEIPYRELTDLSLRFYATLDSNTNIGNLDQNYQDSTGKYEYYNVNNIYNNLGYWDDEIYRFGVVYIMKDYTLSPVFNIRGTEYIGQLDDNGQISTYSSYSLNDSNIYDENGHRNYIPIDKYTFSINTSDNSKGVVRIKSVKAQITSNGTNPIGIKIEGWDPENLMTELKKYTIGCIFVRQKRIATTLCQGVTIGIERNSYLPTLPIGNDKYLMESFLTEDRVLSHNFNTRRREIEAGFVREGSAMICPEYELDYAFFNQFFTGGEFTLKLSLNNLSLNYCNVNSTTHFYNIGYNDTARTDGEINVYRVISLQDSLALAKNLNLLYSAMAGTAEEVGKVSYYKYKNASKKATNILRGAFGPYLGLEKKLPTEDTSMDVFDIKIPNYNEANILEYFLVRYLDTSPFMPISERLDWNTYEKSDKVYFRGDCFICNFTHRMLRNFADPTAPYNDEFIDTNNWADNMDLNDSDTFSKTNRGDVNAVKLGHWFTTKVCSNLNLSIRSVDHSWAAEEGLTNKPRAFYPLYPMNTSGENKVPESNVYNNGFSVTLSSKYNFETPDVPAIKNIFNTRIIYSDIAVNDAFRNGIRVFDLTHFKDYTLTYGSLIKLIELKGNLLAIFEHGICLIPVNERAVAASGAGGNVFINTSNVLPDNPLVLTDMYGTQWAESVVKTPNFVYGIDTVAKKIWRTNGQSVDLISDFKVLKFLIDNITLTEKETLPIIGIRNVKSHYNAYKGDIMFTFYDNINTIEEKVWNLCYSEITLTFTTFYSWIPSYSVNIDNIMFSFDRNTSKQIAECSDLYPQFWLEGRSRRTFNLLLLNADGYIIDENSKIDADTEYIDLGIIKTNLDGEYEITMYNDNNNNSYKYTIVYGGVDENEGYHWLVNSTTYEEFDNWTIAIQATLKSLSEDELVLKIVVGNVVYGTVSTMKYGVAYPTTSFWKHGQGGLTPTIDPIRPCLWYGKSHPFEFEFIVLDDPAVHKIFNNLQIISNKAQPESFHFEVVGEVYDWAEDKKNMYCRQEATKQLFLRLGSNIKYNPNYTLLTPKLEKIPFSNYYKKSTYLPLYYKRNEYLDEIYNSYTMMSGQKWDVPRDYSHLSGSEIVYDPQLNEFKVWTHIGCCPIDGYYDKEITLAEYINIINREYGPLRRYVFAWDTGELDNNEPIIKYYERIFYGRIKGNAEYKEDKWYILIPSIIFMLKNEEHWVKPPLIISPSELPNDLITTLIIESVLPKGYTFNDLLILPNTYDNGDALPLKYGLWTARKETKIRDKYVKVRIRYKGDDLAIISAIKTIYTESYA